MFSYLNCSEHFILLCHTQPDNLGLRVHFGHGEKLRYDLCCLSNSQNCNS